jgi:hypothetical protein
MITLSKNLNLVQNEEKSGINVYCVGDFRIPKNSIEFTTRES